MLGGENWSRDLVGKNACQGNFYKLSSISLILLAFTY